MNGLLARYVRLLILGISITACGVNHHAIDHRSTGLITQEQLFQLEPDWKAKYDAYPVTQTATVSNDIKITVLFGLWCHDSEREIPRLLKTLDHWKVPAAQRELILIDRQKKEPAAAVKANRLYFSPLVVIRKDTTEIGRFIERPMFDWAGDLKKIIEGAQK